ncbi:MAG TPA: extracellular solute-binding protein [Firmicutes bacterium]|jgi:putative aldouronate transport system substrate-binding protein|nr:extracellular solute-binding protein [Bacillota bacterium]
MRKNRSVVLSTLLIALLLTACFSGTILSASKFPELDANGRFLKTRSITVEIYDRGNPGGSKPEDNFFTNWIKEGMLRDHNVKVTFVPVPRWTEVDVLNNLLAAGDAPDVCVTYSYPTILTYANMGGVLDLSPYLTDEYKELFPDLWDFLGERFLLWNQDPVNGTVWAIEARLAQNKRINTFVREDWLKKLNLPEPRSLEEFENMLRAFKKNANLLLGKDADKMIPYTTSYDIGWRNEHLFTSFVPESITDKEMYINGFDDRRLLWPGIKEGVRVLNKWYNEGLIWKDFPLYGPGDGTEDNNMKAGYVGAFMHNWDYPYRNGKDSIHYQLQQMAGPDAAFIAVEPFKNDAGIYRKYLAPGNDRKVFFPATNDEPLASMLYVNWITKLENRRFLQIGVEGTNHKVLADGSIQNIAATGDMIMNSLQNIDYTITINGLDLGDPVLTAKSVALGYDLVDKSFIEKAYQLTDNNARYTPYYNVGEIKAEEGMGPALDEKRDNFLVQAVVAKPQDFDKVFDAGMQDYLRSGGQAIIDERRAKYEAFYE